MSQHYSDPSRENKATALPDVEVFYLSPTQAEQWSIDHGSTEYLSGWYWQTCFPGCLPDTEPHGPYETEQEAINAAQEDATDGE